MRVAHSCPQEACLKNLKEQAKVKEVLMSYHPFWLRLGMEVVVNRVAASESLLASFSHPCCCFS
jgi:hypothetical protein